MCANHARNDSHGSTSRRRFLGAATAVGVGALGLSTGPAGARRRLAAGYEEHDGEGGVELTGVQFTNQGTDGTEVHVDATVLSGGGYVAIHDATLFEGEVTGSVIGVTEYLGPGAHYRVPVTLFDVPGGDFDRDSLEGTSPLIAMPHQETDHNETYDFVSSGGESDGPYAEAGLPAVDAGFATVDGEDGGDDQFALLEFRNQSVADGSVTVEAAVLSDGGFVTLHDARLLQGDALGSVVGVSEYLEPGLHPLVEIEVDDPEGITEVELPARPLLPMPHFDTNDNQAYDFVETEGSDDGPYTEAGQAIVDAGLVTLEEM